MIKSERKPTKKREMKKPSTSNSHVFQDRTQKVSNSLEPKQIYGCNNQNQQNTSKKILRKKRSWAKVIDYQSRAVMMTPDQRGKNPLLKMLIAIALPITS